MRDASRSPPSARTTSWAAAVRRRGTPLAARPGRREERVVDARGVSVGVRSARRVGGSVRGRDPASIARSTQAEAGLRPGGASRCSPDQASAAPSSSRAGARGVRARRPGSTSSPSPTTPPAGVRAPRPPGAAAPRLRCGWADRVSRDQQQDVWHRRPVLVRNAPDPSAR